ncbi:energy transducer TonB [Algoriphagus aquimarinus]|uniref:energy transducer TonB n=1 Tax=Algoriphagus aquimarinus TaxID=237018 RepID=UPI0030DA4E35|tara:strand:+ start:230034 stop:230648 length:615 start_codon:yes stop_codon:yes gene_type:complete
MKKLTSSFLLLFLIGTIGAFAQTKSSNGEMNRLLSKNIKYPSELRQAEIQGPVVISIQIDRKGDLTGEYQMLSGDSAFEGEIQRTVSMLQENWNPEFLEGKSFDKEYLMTFNFKLSAAGSEFPPKPFIAASKKEKEMSPLETVENALSKNPFSSKLYTYRAELLESKGKRLQAEMDLNQAKFLEEKMLTEIVIVGYLPAGPKSL